MVNGVLTKAPKTRNELIEFAFDKKKILIAVNAEKILNATDSSRSLINKNIGYPDGIGAVWALKRKGIKEVEKIPGCELWLEIITQKHLEKSFYFIGATQDIIEQTIHKLKCEFPSIDIVNYRNGYIKTEKEKEILIQNIKELKPDVVFVAMGSPKQEMLIDELQKAHRAVYQGLGGSFDVYVGNVKRAPQWWVRNNLEWAYRLINQPSRLKRQIHLVRFLFLLVLKRL